MSGGVYMGEEDIYDLEKLEEFLEDEEISCEEEAFIKGYLTAG